MLDGKIEISPVHQDYLAASLGFIEKYYPDFSHQQKIFLVIACMALAFPERRAELAGQPDAYLDFAKDRIQQVLVRAQAEVVKVDEQLLNNYLANFQEIFNARGQYLDRREIIRELVEVGVLKEQNGQFLILGKYADGIVHFGDCDFLLEAGNLITDINNLRSSKILSVDSDEKTSRFVMKFEHGISPVIDGQIIHQVGQVFPDYFVSLDFIHQHQIVGIYLNDQRYFLFSGEKTLFEFDSKPYDFSFSENFSEPTGYVLTEKSAYYFVLGELRFQTSLADFSIRTINFSFCISEVGNIETYFWGTLEKEEATIPFLLAPIEELTGFGAIKDTIQFLHYQRVGFGKYQTESGIVYSLSGKSMQTLRGELITEFLPNPDFEQSGLALIRTTNCSFPMVQGQIYTSFENARIEQFIPLETSFQYRELTGWLITNLGVKLVIEGETFNLPDGLSFCYDPETPPQIFLDHFKQIYFVGPVMNDLGEINQLVLMAGREIQIIVSDQGLDSQTVSGYRNLYVNGHGDFQCVLEFGNAERIFSGERKGDTYEVSLGKFDAAKLTLVGFNIFGEYIADGKLHPFLGQEMLARMVGVEVDQVAIIDENTHVTLFHSKAHSQGLVIGDKIHFEGEQFRELELSSSEKGDTTRVDFGFCRKNIKHQYGFTLYYS